MGKDTGFLEFKRQLPEKAPVEERLTNYREIYRDFAEEQMREQGARCMDCGVPFCHAVGCPLGNLIPDWNEAIFRGHWRDASELLHATNNFPEVTGRICPAPCEASCTLNINDDPVTIRNNELVIVERAFEEQWVVPEPPKEETGKTVAVIGSGPAGLAAAQQLRRAGHTVTVFERSDRPGGLLRYGIPDFKLEKHIIDRRLDQMEAEGVKFETCVQVGVDVSAKYLRKRFDAVCLCVGAGQPRDLPVPGRELKGIHYAVDYLTQQNRRIAGLDVDGEEITADGRRVVILGGGDTGADCVGTALRQGARSVHQLEILPRPPVGSDPNNPWPLWPNILRTSTSHEEGGERRWSVCTKEFLGAGGKVRGLSGVEVALGDPDETGRPQLHEVADSEFEMEADLVLLAMGFVHPVHEGLLDDMRVDYDPRGNVKVDSQYATSVPGVFAAGDSHTGAWLIVTAITAGRGMARATDLYLMGQSSLPAPPFPKR